MDATNILAISHIMSSRVFIGFDGKPYIAGKFGNQVATALALALLHRPILRVDGYREGCEHA